MNAKLYAACALLLLSPTLSLGQTTCQRFGAGEHSVIEEICAYRGGLAAFKVQDSWGLLDLSGNVVVAPEFRYIADFSEGLALVRTSEKAGFVDRTGKLVLPLKFEDAGSFREGLAPAELNGKWGYIDKAGRWVIEPTFYGAHGFHQGAALVSEVYGQLSLISRTGERIKAFDGAVHVEGQGFNASGLALLRTDAQGQRVNLDGRRLPLLNSITLVEPVRDGVVVASMRGQAAGETRYGLMDIQGSWRVPPQWSHLGDWDGSLAIAKKPADDERYGLIDGHGKEVVPFVYARLERDKESGLYVGVRNDDGPERRDVLSSTGGRLAELACAEHGQQLSGRLGVVLHGCGTALVVTRDGNHFTATIEAKAEPRLSESSQHLLLSFSQHGIDNEGGKGDSFILLDRSGAVMLSSDHPSVKGRFNQISLIQGKGELALGAPDLLPLAVLHANGGAMAILTHKGQIVTRPEWVYSGVSVQTNAVAIDGPLPVRTASGFGAIDGKGDWVIEPRFDELSMFQFGVAFAKKLNRSLMVDNRGEIHAFPTNAGNFTPVAPYLLEGYNSDQKRVRFNLKNGQLVTLPGESRSLSFDDAGKFIQGLAAMQEGERWGLVNEAGEWVVPARYSKSPEPIHSEAELLGWLVTAEYRMPFPTYQGEVQNQELRGVLDPKGNELLGLKYEQISFDPSTRLFRVATDDGTGMASLRGEMLIEPAHERLTYLGEGWFEVQRKPLYGVIDSRGEWVLAAVPGIFDSSWFHGHGGVSTYAQLHIAGRGVLLDTRARVSSPEQPLQAPEERPDDWWSIHERSYGSEARNETIFYGFDWTERLRVPGKVEHGFSEGLAVLDDGESKFLIDARGRKVAPLPYKIKGSMVNGMAVITQEIPASRKNKVRASAFYGTGENTRYGYIDSKGRLAIPARFERAQDFSESRATVTNDGNLGVIDNRGRLLVQGAWLCGRDPILIDGQKRVIWPKGLSTKVKC